MTANGQEFCTPKHRREYLKELATERSYQRLCRQVDPPRLSDSTGNNYHNSDEYCPEDEP